jgi:hypothetical protein
MTLTRTFSAPDRLCVLLAVATAVGLTSCTGEGTVPTQSPSTSSAASATPSPSTSPTNECTMDIYWTDTGGYRISTTGDLPEFTHDADGLSFKCAGGPEIQVQSAQADPALTLDCEGDHAELVDGESAAVGPYRATLVEQSDSGGRLLSLTVEIG